MSSGGVQLASGYISLTVKKAGDFSKEISAEITGIEKVAKKSGDAAGQAIGDGITKGAKGAGRSIGDAITSGAAKAGEAAGTAIGDGITKRVSEASKDAGKSIQDEITKAGKNTKVTPQVDTKPARDAIIKDIGGAIIDAARDGAKEAGYDLDQEFIKAAGKVGKSVGEALHDAIPESVRDSLSGIRDTVQGAAEGIRNVGDAVVDLKNGNPAAALTDISKALTGIGQSGAGDAVGKFATTVDAHMGVFKELNSTLQQGVSLLESFAPAAAAAAGPWAALVAAGTAGGIGLGQGIKSLQDAQERKVFQGVNDQDRQYYISHGLPVQDPLKPQTSGDNPPIIPTTKDQAQRGLDLVLPPDLRLPKRAKGGVTPAGQIYGPGTGTSDSIIGVGADGLPTARVSTGEGVVNKSAMDSGWAPMVAAANSGVKLPGYDDGTTNVGGPPIPVPPKNGFPGIPLVQTPSGAWTSPNPAWAHLIQRESSGINQRQQIHDVNSGGNEAEGLFQITPRTWAAHGGTRLAPSPLLATPQQQAQIAASILKSNPSGSDWGAGLPGRENPNELLSGILPGWVGSGGGSGNLTGGGATGGSGGGASGNNPIQALGSGGGGAANLDALLGNGGDPASPFATGGQGGKQQRTQGYIPAGAGSKGQAGTSFAAGALQMGAQAINGLIDQAASAAATAVSAAATAGSFGAGGQAAGPAAAAAIGIGTQAAKRGVQYGFQVAGIAADAIPEILLPFGVPRFFQTDPTQFIPQLPGQAAATTTGEKSQDQQNGVPTGPDEQPGGPVQPGQLPGQQPVGQSVPLASPGTGDYTPAPAGTPALSGPQGQPAAPAPQAPAPAAPQPAPAAPPAAPAPAPPPQHPGLIQGGPQNAIPDLLRGITAPPGVFDTGGWLMPNGIAINRSSRPEPILNGQQFDTLHAIASQGMPTPDPKANGGSSNDYSVRIENVTVKDVNEMQKEIDSRQRLQMMRYSGRP